MIDIYVDEEIDTTFFSSGDEVCTQDIIKAIDGFYKGKPTRNMLWDFTTAEKIFVTSEEVREIAQFTKRISHSRPDGKTAIVVSGDFSYGLSRMYECYAEIEQQSIVVRSFRSKDKALAWIKD